MSRYIDADELTEFYEPYKDMKVPVNALLEQIKDTPSADIEPVRHGHWEQDGHHIRCSECGTYFCIIDREGDSFPINYCPCCGAKMDGEGQKIKGIKALADQ